MMHPFRFKALVVSTALSALVVGWVKYQPPGLRGEEPQAAGARGMPLNLPVPGVQSADAVYLEFSIYRTHGPIAGLKWHEKAGRGEGLGHIVATGPADRAATGGVSRRPKKDPAAPSPSAVEQHKEARCMIFERDGKRWNVHMGDLNLSFERLSYSFGGTEFLCDEEGWKFDGKPEPARGGPIETIATPRVIAVIGQSFEIAVGSERPVQYFVKRPDGLFELKALKIKPPDGLLGLRLSTRVEKTTGDKIRLDDLTLMLQAIGDRKPIEGVNLDVGEPVLTKKQLTATVTIEPEADCGVIFAPPGEGAIILRIHGVFVRSPEKDSR